MERKEEEIVQLNDELDAKVRNQEKEIGEVEAEWRDELQEAKAQVEELKDVRRRLSLLTAMKLN